MKKKAEGRRQKAEGISRKIKRIGWILFSFIFFPSSFFLIFFWWFQGWNGREPINVVVSVDEKIWLLAVRPAEKYLVEIEFPSNTLIPAESGGKWLVRALWELSKLNGNLKPVTAVGWDLFEVPVDGIVRLKSWQSENTPYPILSFSDQDEIWSWPEKVRLVKFVRSLNQTQIKKIDLEKTLASRKVVDPTGAEFLELKTEVLSSQISDWFEVEQIRQEGVAVAVKNVGGISRAGAKMARQLEHSGIRVISVSDGGSKPSIIVRNKKFIKTLTVVKLSRWFGINPTVGDFDERAEILIVVK